MSIEAMKITLAALERGRPQIVGALVQQDQDAAITALRTAIEQATVKESLQVPPEAQPQKSQWVGLTDDEQTTLYDRWAVYQEYGPEESGWFDFARAIEARLKEKNT
jgi:hypothetical protein